MNPSTALARVLVDELARCGVTEAVLSPGSRSAPLAYALHAADAAGRLRLHVRIDERSAGFLALGLAKASGRAVPVVTTSGTAVANLHPAAVEAAYAGVPLLLLTADRPPELRGVGANQAIDQLGLFAPAVRTVEVGAPDRRAGQNAFWRSVVSRAVADGGPVHLNLAFREPLVPDPDDEWVEPLDGRAGGLPWTVAVPAVAVPPPDDLPDRTVVVLGDATVHTRRALDLAVARGFPVVAEPSSGAPPGPNVLPGGDSALASGPRPDRVLLVGRATLSRAVTALLRSAPLDVVAARETPDPARTAARILPGVPVASGGTDPAWLPAWLDAVPSTVERDEEAVLAAAVLDAIPPGGLLVTGSSKPIRDVFLAGPRDGVTVLANRGVAGIDGTVSTAIGAALAHGGPAYALVGDLTFLHDANGLVLGAKEPRPDLTIVVVNNDGGAIFATLEQGAPELADAFERVFGTPHGVDLAALCAATGTPHRRATPHGLHLDKPDGIRVVEVRTSR